jgi:hypothetical protein
MSCGISSPKQLFRLMTKRKGPLLPIGLQTIGGDGLPSAIALYHHHIRQGGAYTPAFAKGRKR